MRTRGHPYSNSYLVSYSLFFYSLNNVFFSNIGFSFQLKNSTLTKKGGAHTFN